MATASQTAPQIGAGNGGGGTQGGTATGMAERLVRAVFGRAPSPSEVQAVNAALSGEAGGVANLVLRGWLEREFQESVLPLAQAFYALYGRGMTAAELGVWRMFAQSVGNAVLVANAMILGSPYSPLLRTLSEADVAVLGSRLGFSMSYGDVVAARRAIFESELGFARLLVDAVLKAPQSAKLNAALVTLASGLAGEGVEAVAIRSGEGVVDAIRRVLEQFATAMVSTPGTTQTALVLNGSAQADLIQSGPGNDAIYGDGGNDTLNGGDGNDTIRGGPGNDVVQGGNGEDHLYGNGGADTLTGGGGRDVFYLDDMAATDRITDFQVGNEGDRLNVSGVYASGVTLHPVVVSGNTPNVVNWVGMEKVVLRHSATVLDAIGLQGLFGGGAGKFACPTTSRSVVVVTGGAEGEARVWLARWVDVVSSGTGGGSGGAGSTGGGSGGAGSSSGGGTNPTGGGCPPHLAFSGFALADLVGVSPDQLVAANWV